jgi:hypothetical protein
VIATARSQVILAGKLHMSDLFGPAVCRRGKVSFSVGLDVGQIPQQLSRRVICRGRGIADIGDVSRYRPPACSQGAPRGGLRGAATAAMEHTDLDTVARHIRAKRQVSNGQSRSLTCTSPPLASTVIRAGQTLHCRTELPSWSCGFDYCHPTIPAQPKSGQRVGMVLPRGSLRDLVLYPG